MSSSLRCFQNRPLEKLCIDSFNQYVMRVVKEVRESYGLHTPLTDTGIVQILQSVHDYILKTVYPFLIDVLLENVDAQRAGERARQMLLEIYMNEDMVRFNPAFRAINPSPATFYESKIRRMGNLVALNLKMVATDELLKVVGESCPHLQVIDIVSKMGTMQTISTINALKLEFFVSDEGLRYLHPLKKLRRIIMRKIVGSNCGGRLVTYEGIRQLLRALPRLEYVRYNNMGYVISGTDSIPAPFNLRHLHDDHASTDHIEMMEIRCPKLTTVCLYIPTYSGSNSIQRGQECLKRLANSKLNLSAVFLRAFPCGSEFDNFTALKGFYLKHLKLHTYLETSIKSFIELGKNCPNLVSVDFFTSTTLKDCTRAEYEPHVGKHFQKLEHLTVIAQDTDLEALLGLCTIAATYLETLQVMNYGYIKPSRTALSKLLARNSLQYLKLFVSKGYEYNLDHLTKFLVRTTSLEKVAITEGEPYPEYLTDLKLRHNLSYTITDDIPSRTCCHCFDFN